MTRTVTAFFDSRSEAESARTRLSSQGIDASRVRIIDQNSASSGGSEGGFWNSLKSAFVPDEDHHAYSEGMRRGGFLLTAEVEEAQADQAIRILDDDGAVDFDQRQEEWRSSGWSGYQGSEASGMSGMGTTGAATGTTSSSLGATGRTGTSSEIAEEHIPIVEEQLKVGKREVERGGARVRSYVRETPVHEQVTLRDEHVSVERRPVSGDMNTVRGTAPEGLFEERNIEMTERHEEAVVAKEARVAEELVVRKTSEEHVENIDDTVRRTEVDVDEGTTGTDRSAFFDRDRDGRSDLTGSDRDRTTADTDGFNRTDKSRL